MSSERREQYYETNNNKTNATKHQPKSLGRVDRASCTSDADAAASRHDGVLATSSKSSSSSSTGAAPGAATALFAGGLAGITVDVVLFPIDTIKTRLQAPVGFVKAGGFRGIYNGIGAAASGAAPGAALFFCTYEGIKRVFADQQQEGSSSQSSPSAFAAAAAASGGEAAACLIRVPTEVVKSKMQTCETAAAAAASTSAAEGAAASPKQNPQPQQRRGLLETIRMVYHEKHGGSPVQRLFGGLYRGYGITLFREIPFSAIQFPLYEGFKVWWSRYYNSNDEPCTVWQASISGAVSGGIAAGLTTPLDVLKTRIMLGKDKHGVPYEGVGDVYRKTVSQEGYGALFSGIQPRIIWISAGGFVFLGSYEFFKDTLKPMLG